MRLLHRDSTGDIRLADDFGDGVIPRYAILSHTWEEGQEVSFQDMQNSTGKEKNGWKKLEFCAEKSKEASFDYFWVDTCCIDKSSSAELQEALNSMFRWYSEAELCLVYLSDVEKSQRWKIAFRKSRWFTRGWTLQELLAPDRLEFYSKEGTYLGSKRTLEQSIHEIAGVHFDALRGKHLSGFSKDERMSWAANRQTKREEDAAYSLFGIFNVYLPVIYGEGRKNAFRRLEDEISKEQPKKLPAYAGTQKNLSEQKMDETTKRRRTLRDSLAFAEMDVRYAAIKPACTETCEWIVEQQEYKEWLDAGKLPTHNGLLWIKGKPGAGKSTIMKYMLDQAPRTVASCQTIAYFFNARGGTLEKSTIGTYRSLLLQLMNQFPESTQVLDRISSSMLDPTGSQVTRPWDPATLQDLLSKAVLSCSHTPLLCFIDALDECEEQQIRDMIEFLDRLGGLAVAAGISLRICLSSRHYPQITIRRGISLILDGHDGHSQDIAVYLNAALRIERSPFAQSIRATIQARASGVFMWVVLVVAILNREYDHGRLHRLHQKLGEIPNDLYELFHDILTRDCEDSNNTALCIQWLLFSERPLHPAEMYCAILAGSEPQACSDSNISVITENDIERFIISCSKGLSEIVKARKDSEARVQFIHESVREYLTSTMALETIWPCLAHNFEGQSHDQLQKCCLAYLDADIDVVRLEGARVKDPKQATEITIFRQNNTGWYFPSYPFILYALNGALHHAECAAKNGVDQQEFLNRFPLTKWIQYHGICMRETYHANASLAYILAACNLPNLAKTFPAHTYLTREIGTRRTPLSAALEQRSAKFLQVLAEAYATTLERGSPLRMKCQTYRSPMKAPEYNYSRALVPITLAWNEIHQLIYPGDEVLLALLIHAKDDNLTDICFNETHEPYRDTPLLCAVRTNKRTMAQILLRTEHVDVNAGDDRGVTALMMAASIDDRMMVKDLVEIGGADPCKKNIYHETALDMAISKSNEDIVQ